MEGGTSDSGLVTGFVIQGTAGRETPAVALQSPSDLQGEGRGNLLPQAGVKLPRPTLGEILAFPLFT